MQLHLHVTTLSDILQLFNRDDCEIQVTDCNTVYFVRRKYSSNYPVMRKLKSYTHLLSLLNEFKKQ